MTEQDIRNFSTLTEIVNLARRKLDDGTWDMIAGGSETETTLMRNRQALDEISLQPRVLRDVHQVDASAAYLGLTQRLPVVLAPVGPLAEMYPEGVVTVANAGEEFGATTIISSSSEHDMVALAQMAKKPLIYQL